MSRDGFLGTPRIPETGVKIMYRLSWEERLQPFSLSKGLYYTLAERLVTQKSLKLLIWALLKDPPFNVYSTWHFKMLGYKVMQTVSIKYVIDPLYNTEYKKVSEDKCQLNFNPQLILKTV